MLDLDPSNPVVAAIGRGTVAETAGDLEAARVAYEEAWEAASDDFERCIAAHYVPRALEDRADRLRWNEDALRFADAVADERVLGFYPSLHASVGISRFELGDAAGAIESFEAALRSVEAVPDDGFRAGLAAMIEERLALAKEAEGVQ